MLLCQQHQSGSVTTTGGTCALWVRVNLCPHPCHHQPQAGTERFCVPVTAAQREAADVFCSSIICQTETGAPSPTITDTQPSYPLSSTPLRPPSPLNCQHVCCLGAGALHMPTPVPPCGGPDYIYFILKGRALNLSSVEAEPTVTDWSNSHCYILPRCSYPRPRQQLRAWQPSQLRVGAAGIHSSAAQRTE